MKIRWYKNGKLDPFNGDGMNGDNKSDEMFLCRWDEGDYFIIEKIVSDKDVIILNNFPHHTGAPIKNYIKKLTKEEVQDFIELDKCVSIWDDETSDFLNVEYSSLDVNLTN